LIREKGVFQMEDNQKFTLDLLEEVDNSYHEQEEISIIIKGKEKDVKSKLKVDKYFHPAKVKECVKELFQKLDILRNYTELDEKDNHIFKLWLMLLIVKHFSELDIPKSFKKQLAILEKLTESTVLYQIFSSFSVDEIKKVMAELDRRVHLTMTKLEAFEPYLKEIEETLQKKG
jgi:hypothetical protein